MQKNNHSMKLKMYVKEKINCQLRLNNLDIMLGYLLSDQNRTPINILLVLTKNTFLTLLKIIPLCV